MINIFQPSYGDDELLALKELFATNWLGKGGKTKEFENDFAEFLGVESSQVMSTNSCTEAVFQILEYLNFDADCEIILPTISFVGVANAILSCGLRPVFCDVESASLNATIDFIDSKKTDKTKAVILIHYGGGPCDILQISEYCIRNNLILIEDSACSLYSRVGGRSCGTFGDFGVWSFDAMKMVVAGDGGMIFAKNKDDIKNITKNSYLGMTGSVSGFNSKKIDDKWWEFNVEHPGRRSIMNDITATLGLTQLKKIDSFYKRREEINNYYNANLSNIKNIKLPKPIDFGSRHSYYFYWIQIQTTNYEKIRGELSLHLREAGVYTTFRYYPLHRVPIYGHSKSMILKNSDLAADSTICIPIHQSLTDNELIYIVENIKQFFKE